MPSVPTLPSWGMNHDLTNTDFQQLNTVINFLRNPPGCRSKRSNSQSVNNAALTGLLFTTDIEDPDGFHSTSTNTDRFLPTYPGLYAVKYTAGFVFNATGFRSAWLELNGTTPAGGYEEMPAGGGVSVMSGAEHVRFNGTTDYLRLVVFQTSGGALNTVDEGTVTQGAPRLSLKWCGT